MDRVEDGDAVSDSVAAVEGFGPGVLADSERRAAIHRLHHAIVDHTIGVAKDVWARALPGLRAAWEQHVERYPHPAQVASRTQADGSWVCDGNRKLTPEQNAELDRGIGRIQEVGRQVIIPGMRAIEAEDTSRCLAGFKHCFKGEDRLKEKVADRMRSKGRPPTEALAGIPDAVRFTFQYTEIAYTAAMRKDIQRLEARGFIQVERRNTWSDDQYKGVNSRWRDPESRVIFEVQFHTQASREAKQLTHEAYERIRSSVSDEERGVLKEFQRRVNSLIPIPPDVTDIDDYPPGEA